jgi:predicted nucleic acid-binding protein
MSQKKENHYGLPLKAEIPMETIWSVNKQFTDQKIIHSNKNVVKKRNISEIDHDIHQRGIPSLTLKKVTPLPEFQRIFNS